MIRNKPHKTNARRTAGIFVSSDKMPRENCLVFRGGFSRFPLYKTGKI